MRHGKSDWDADYGRDHDRPLAKRGQRAAPRIGRFLTAAGWAPDRVVTSTAFRARDTARLVSEAGGWEGDLVEDPDLYGMSLDSLVELIRSQPASVETLVLVGHNPTWSWAASALTGGGSVRLPTAAAAGIAFPRQPWSAVAPGQGELRFLVTPRSLKEP